MNQQMLRPVLTASLLLSMTTLFGACAAGVSGGSSNDQAGAKSQLATKSYDLADGKAKCDTGKHEFTSADAAMTVGHYCAALQDEALNNECALELRTKLFAVECKGEFKPVPKPGIKPDLQADGAIAHELDHAMKPAGGDSEIIQLPDGHDVITASLLPEASEQYEYADGQCTTDLHVFKGTDPAQVRRDLCAALQDDMFNNDCARLSRTEHFEQSCSFE